MQLIRFRAGDRVVADHYYGLEQTLDGLRLAFWRQAADGGGVIGTLTNNGTVEERTPSTSAAGVQVRGPAVALVPYTPPVSAPATYVGGEFFAILDDITLLDLPTLDTVGGQSRQDLVVANINVGQFSTYAFQAVKGTPATTGVQVDPTVPANSLVLARVTRVHGAGAITNAMITDLRKQLVLGAPRVEDWKAVTYATPYVPDPAEATVHAVTLTGNITISAPLNPQLGSRLRFVFTQDATAGRTVTFNAVFKTNWTPTTTNGKINTIDFVYNGANWIQVGSAVGL